MSDNENRKNSEELADEALDNVAGGITPEQWQQARQQALAQYKDPCIVCKTTEGVKYYAYRNNVGCYGAQYFCPACRDLKIQQGYEVWEY